MKPIFETKPKRNVLERVISRLSLQCTDYSSQDSSGGIPEFVQTDFAAALAGLNDPIASNLVGALMDESRPRIEIEHSLALWGWIQWFRENRRPSMNLELNRRMAVVALVGYLRDTEPAVKDVLAFLGIGPSRWGVLRDHYADLCGRLRQAEADMVAHLSMRLDRWDGSETVPNRLRRAGI